jgi:hypothetical protein
MVNLNAFDFQLNKKNCLEKSNKSKPNIKKVKFNNKHDIIHIKDMSSIYEQN